MLWSARKRFRIFNVVDNFNREALAIEIDLNIPAQGIVRVPDRIVANRRYALKMRMENGPELVSLALVQWAEEQFIVKRTRRRRYSSYCGEVDPAPENLLDRNFISSRPNEK